MSKGHSLFKVTELSDTPLQFLPTVVQQLKLLLKVDTTFYFYILEWTRSLILMALEQTNENIVT